MRIKCSHKFFAYHRASYEGQVNIRLRITLSGEIPIDISTGFNIAASDWDSSTQQARPTCPMADEINRTILLWNATLSEVLSRYELIERRRPTRGELKDLFNDLIGHPTPLNSRISERDTIPFYDCFDLFVEKRGRKNAWTRATIQKFKALKKHLLRYDALLSFHTLTENKLQGYVDYLLARGMKNTTIAKNLAFLRWFLRWAYYEDYYHGHLHDTFKPKLKGVATEKEIIYLTRDELHILATYQFPPSQWAIERVRDVFLFCCYSGLRYSDVKKLRRSDIKGDYIQVVTKKTIDGLRIELNRHTRAILDKYRDKPLDGDAALPVLSNHKMNEHLKALGRICDLSEPTRVVYFHGSKRIEEVFPKWQLLTTHVARRTFVVTALQLGIPAEVIMKWTGHSRFEAMKPYIAIVDDLKRISMQKFDDL